jgi:hypothetical protein
MEKDERVVELERIGFTIESELEYILLDPFDVAVECENDEIIPFCVSSSTRFLDIANETPKKLKLPNGNVERMIRASETNEGVGINPSR